jgi:hypothetical protein
MLQSNQPYQRVDGGIGAGLISGGLVGAAAIGGYHWQGARLNNFLQSKAAMARSYEKLAKDDIAETKRYAGSTAVSDAQRNLASHMEKVAGRWGKMADRTSWAHGKMFGGGKWGKAISYGAGILGGALIGGAIDGMSD